MKVALLISGYLRTFKLNIPLIKSKILDQFDSVDVYIHITKNESKDDRYFNLTNEIEDITYINNILNPTTLIFEDNMDISDDKKKNDVSNLWIKYYKLNELKKINESIGGKYDLVIKYRPDLNLISDNIFTGNVNKDIVYIPKDSVIDKSKLTNVDDKYICDIFAYGNSNIMNDYFDIYQNIGKIGKKNGYISETLLYNHLIDNNIKYELVDIEYNVILSMCNVFAICGDSGSGKTTLGGILKKYFNNSFMLECDRYHKWERGDDNWKKFTHLNPDANYLTKMNDDIFDLKIGKSIYQVDYNHSNGKFTEKEQIDKSDNIIVCGLHSLYSKNDNVYNLKIFIDTDVNLKKKWKIKRDISKRGYTMDQILNQINSREEDFQNFIYPQRDKSDIIINFFTNVEFTLDDIDKESDIYLRIFISKKYPLIDILSNLSKKEIKFQIDSESDENFNKITFYEYKECDILGDYYHLNNYYDYIMFFILSLQQRN
jgi:uridine kinase